LAPAPLLKPGTRLLREWGGKTHTVIALDDGFEYDGEWYQSLTQIARRITGAHWSGPRFFGLRRTRYEQAGSEPRASMALCHLHPQILRGGTRTGVQFAACPARGLRSLYPEPAARRLDLPPTGLRRWRAVGRDDRTPCPATAPRRHPAGPSRYRYLLQGRPADPF